MELFFNSIDTNSIRKINNNGKNLCESSIQIIDIYEAIEKLISWKRRINYRIFFLHFYLKFI